MKDWNIYEYITPIIGEPFNEFVGTVQARTEASALNKAKKMFKVELGGVPVRHRNPENFKAKPLMW